MSAVFTLFVNHSSIYDSTEEIWLTLIVTLSHQICFLLLFYL